ncbi:hypothetical protein OE88DRAFT_1649250 [Heliocybe sulcata]|uniref:Retrotransposon Copia-like N-terminal domain-containing protein n=1 Tax=Heliocybe sulcata TaxID=5364 RepID=A0A5C3MJ73_9AGAM|nr:hypothetical protein OE88DRAFT_1649250 [Heliocybe sulcata]
MSSVLINSSLEKVPTLTGENYSQWQGAMSMLFRITNSLEVVTGGSIKPTVAARGEEQEAFGARQAEWISKNSQALGFIWAKKILGAQRDLTRMGHKIEDYLVKDSIIRNLDSSFDVVRTSILTQPSEPDLTTVLSILQSSSAAMGIDSVKMEETEAALAVRSGGRSRKDKGKSSGSHRHCYRDTSSGSGSDSDAEGHGGVKDDKGCTGHQASRCMKEMLQKVKDWIMKQVDRAHLVEEDYAYGVVLDPPESPYYSSSDIDTTGCRFTIEEAY